MTAGRDDGARTGLRKAQRKRAALRRVSRQDEIRAIRKEKQKWQEILKGKNSE